MGKRLCFETERTEFEFPSPLQKVRFGSHAQTCTALARRKGGAGSPVVRPA